jgi:hypothetical protein
MFNWIDEFWSFWLKTFWGGFFYRVDYDTSTFPYFVSVLYHTLLLLNNVTTYSYKLLVKSTRPTFSCYPIMAIDEVSWALKDTVTDVDISFLVIHFVNNYIRWKCHDQGFLSIYLSYLLKSQVTTTQTAMILCNQSKNTSTIFNCYIDCYRYC